MPKRNRHREMLKALGPAAIKPTPPPPAKPVQTPPATKMAAKKKKGIPEDIKRDEDQIVNRFNEKTPDCR